MSSGASSFLSQALEVAALERELRGPPLRLGFEFLESRPAPFDYVATYRTARAELDAQYPGQRPARAYAWHVSTGDHR